MIPVAVPEGVRNAATSSMKLETDDLPYMISALQRTIGKRGSMDPTSLMYRLTQLEDGYATLAQIASTSADTVSNGTLLGTQNGANTTFSTLSDFVTASTKVYINGQRVTLGGDYTESGTSAIIFTVAPLSTDTLRIDYIKG